MASNITTCNSRNLSFHFIAIDIKKSLNMVKVYKSPMKLVEKVAEREVKNSLIKHCKDKSFNTVLLNQNL